MNAITTAKASRCGCSGGCCGSDVGAGICPDGAIARPRFFAGQLLTHEDMQLIVDYVVGKNRLHNRFLFGEGVVCGLSVTCPPCGDGSVVVAPGYALDCCGNDIFLPCPMEVDVNTLVRELRKRQLDGWDCGDPCVVRKCEEDQDNHQGTADARRNAIRELRGIEDVKDEAPEPLTYHYCLYVKYNEMQIAPVAPYVTDAACGAIACEPSRTCEGFTFELRCESERSAPVDLLTRLRACIGDFREAAMMAQRAYAYSARGADLRRASFAMSSEAPVLMEVEDVAAMKSAAERLNEAAFAGDAVAMEETAFRSHLADYEMLSVGLARAAALSDANRPAGLAEAARLARVSLERASDPIARLSADLLSDPVSREAAADLIGVAGRTVLTPDGTSPNPAEIRMLRSGAAMSANQVDRMQTDLGSLKAFLEDRIQRLGATTSCDLIDRVRRVRIGADGSLDAASARSTADAADELAAILLDMVRDCFCLALNPPCAPCEDPALLLACLTVRDCEVIDICNMGRRFVLSPAALRYWLPPVTAIGRLLEKFCCEFEFKRPRRPKPVLEEGRIPLETETSFYRMTAVPSFSAARVEPDTKLEIERTGVSLSDVEHLSILGSHIGSLGLARAPELTALASMGVRLTSPFERLRRELHGELETRVAETRDATRAEVVAAVDDRTGTLRDEAVAAAREAALESAEVTREQALAAAREEATVAADKRTAAAHTETLKAARSEMATILEKSRAMRKLATENERLKTELKRISDAVKKLQK